MTESLALSHLEMNLWIFQGLKSGLTEPSVIKFDRQIHVMDWVLEEAKFAHLLLKYLFPVPFLTFLFYKNYMTISWEIV